MRLTARSSAVMMEFASLRDLGMPGPAAPQTPGQRKEGGAGHEPLNTIYSHQLVFKANNGFILLQRHRIAYPVHECHKKNLEPEHWVRTIY